MANFMYLLGDPESRQALIVDPAWDVESLLALARQDDYTIVGALITHYHPDHVGGDLWGDPGGRSHSPAGIGGRTSLCQQERSGEGLKQVTGVADSDLKRGGRR